MKPHEPGTREPETVHNERKARIFLVGHVALVLVLFGVGAVMGGGFVGPPMAAAYAVPKAARAAATLRSTPTVPESAAAPTSATGLDIPGWAVRNETPPPWAQDAPNPNR